MAKIAVVAIARDEKSFMDEWLLYHRLVGIDHFFIYDDDPIPGLQEFLQPHESYTTVIRWHDKHQAFPGKRGNRQTQAYLLCLRTFHDQDIRHICRRKLRQPVALEWKGTVRFHCEKANHHLHLYTGGLAHLCCPGWVVEPIGNIFQSSLTEIWNGDKAEAVRKSIETGEFSYCRSCPHMHPPNGPVRTLADDERIPRKDRIGLLMVGYDFTCNLKCPSCRTSRSIQNVAGDQIVRKVSRRLVESENLQNVDVLGLMGGGDPFASPICQELIGMIPWQSLPLLKIALFTNGLLFNETKWSELGEAAGRVMEVRVSVDAASPETYHLNREGNWQTLLTNLAFMSNLRRKNLIHSFVLNFTVQANNFKEMPAFVELAYLMAVDRISFSNLEQWGTYSNPNYLDRAVHRAEHPGHQELLKVRALTNQKLDHLYPNEPERFPPSPEP